MGTGTLSQEVTGHYHTVSQGLSRHITQVSNPTPNSILFHSAMVMMDSNNVLGFLDFIQVLKTPKFLRVNRKPMVLCLCPFRSMSCGNKCKVYVCCLLDMLLKRLESYLRLKEDLYSSL